MWRLKGCPRCSGDLFLDKDIHNWYEICLQCGYSKDLQILAEAKRKAYRHTKRAFQNRHN
jgi:hypothetical protein